MSGDLYDTRAELSGEILVDPEYALHVEASDTRSGMKRIEVFVDDVSQAFKGGITASCDAACTLDWTLHADDYVDGQHTVKIMASDRVADQPGVPNTHNVVRAFAVEIARPDNEDGDLPGAGDTSAPSPAGEIRLLNYDAASRAATVSWENGEDPDIAFESPGSGITLDQYRQRPPGGDWSPWITTYNHDFIRADVNVGELIDVQVREVDGQGNVSATASGLVAVELTPTSDEPVDVVAAPDGDGTTDLTVEVDIDVRGENAAPASGFRVALERPDGTEIIDDTDANGNASFPGVTPGTYTIKRIGASGFTDAHEMSDIVTVPNAGTSPDLAAR